MKSYKRILDWLIEPSGWQLTLCYFITFLLVLGDVYFIIFPDQLVIISYIVYALSALFLVYSVYSFRLVFKNIKDKIIRIMGKYKFTQKMMTNYKFRTIIFACCAFIINIGFAIFEATMGIMNSSIWFGALASYYIILSAVRGRNLYLIYKSKSVKNVHKKSVKLYRANGYLLVLLTLVFSIAVIQMVYSTGGFEHIGMMIYVSALYTFYKITLAILNIIKAHKQDDYNVKSIRNINLADALVSIVALQTAMFHSFGTDVNTSIPNALTGGIVCILIISIGSAMIIKANQQIKINKENQNNGQ